MSDYKNITLTDGTASRVPYLDSNKKITTSAVTDTELGYLSGATSNIQTQLNGKASSSAVTKRTRATTAFETAGRFTAAAGGTGSTSFGTSGLALQTGATATSFEKILWEVLAVNAAIYSQSPLFSTTVYCSQLNAASGGGNFYIGLGNVTVNGTNITLTNNHIGFKIVKTGGTVSLYGTQGAGAAETATSALTTLADGDSLDLMLQVNGTSSVDYYWAKNGGAISSATNLTTNLPTAAAQEITIACNNAATAFNFSFLVGTANYER